MTPFQEIESDLDWREAELAVFRVLLVSSSVTKGGRTVLFRAAWALLYAHYEGFCKFALTVFYDSLRKSGVPCRSLPFRTQCFALAEPLKKMRGLTSGELVAAISALEINHLDAPPLFPDVHTESNLWPARLEELLNDADIALPSPSFHNRKLETLVRRRNKIAHGERDMINELAYYTEYEDAFKVIAYELAYAIDQKLALILPATEGAASA